MLRSPGGATIDGLMKATGWQRHSVRGFLAGVVRKRLKLNLNSSLIDGRRVYRVRRRRGPKHGSYRTAKLLTQCPASKSQRTRRNPLPSTSRSRVCAISMSRNCEHAGKQPGRRKPQLTCPDICSYRVLAYRLQAERLGDLDAESRRLLDRSDSPEQASRRAADANKRTNRFRPGRCSAASGTARCIGWP